MILRKVKETGFCQYFDEHNQLMSSGIVRRLTITAGSYDLIRVERSHIRSILIFTKEILCEHLMGEILAKYMPLKVLDFGYAQFSQLYDVPENLGNLIHLKYLSFRYTRIQSLPKSIGKLQNLETLDVRNTFVSYIAKEISKLRKLRHLLGDTLSSIEVMDSLGSMTSLEKIRVLKIDPDGLVIKELGKLKHLKDLRIASFREEHTNTLCASIHEMQLEALHIYEPLWIKIRLYPEDDNEIIDLPFMSSLSTVRKLCLNGKLKKLPNWIPQLQNLVKLSLKNSDLTNDPLESLEDMPNLLFLSISSHAYVGETMHFQDGGFQKLKELELIYLSKLNSIFIGRGALHSLKKLQLEKIQHLKTVPYGIQHLAKLEVLNIRYMPYEFEQSIADDGGQEHWMIQHVPCVQITNLSTFPKRESVSKVQ
ncbi:disease resistance protein RPM1 [Cajanus cajan]|nr:disease resistance protein RPM1 [Cajanus cajan]